LLWFFPAPLLFFCHLLSGRRRRRITSLFAGVSPFSLSIPWAVWRRWRAWLDRRGTNSGRQGTKAETVLERRGRLSTLCRYATAGDFGRRASLCAALLYFGRPVWAERACKER
jgi:hypothetical protein